VGRRQFSRAPLPARVSGDLVRPEGSGEHHALIGEVAGEHLEDVPAGGVGPVQVFDADHDRPVGRNAVDERDQGVEGGIHRRSAWCRGGVLCGLQLFAVAQLGRDVADASHEVDDRRKRHHPGADVEALPDEQRDVLSRRGLGQQRRLADAGLTREEHERRRSLRRSRDEVIELLELVGSPYDCSRS
jgi:hypothetical protein